MFSSLSAIRKVIVFFCLVIALSVTTISLIPGEAVVPVNMFTPLVAALLMLFVLTREGYTAAGRASLGLHRAGFRGWGVALLLPLPVLLFNYGLVWSTGLAALVVPGGDVMRLLIKLPIGLMTGLLHAIWHLPLIFLTPYYHSGGNPLIVMPLFLLTLTAAGIIYGYLRLAYDSLWPAVLLHSAFNTYWGLFAAVTVASSPLAAEYLGGESGLLTLIPTAILAGWFLARLRPPLGRLAIDAAR